MSGIPEHWSDLTEDEKRVLLEMAKGHLWWEQFWDRLGWLKNLGVIVMGVVLFLTWGRDAIAAWLQSGGGAK